MVFSAFFMVSTAQYTRSRTFSSTALLLDSYISIVGIEDFVPPLYQPSASVPSISDSHLKQCSLLKPENTTTVATSSSLPYLSNTENAKQVEHLTWTSTEGEEGALHSAARPPLEFSSADRMRGWRDQGRWSLVNTKDGMERRRSRRYGPSRRALLARV